jgi:hypothetical protein
MEDDKFDEVMRLHPGSLENTKLLDKCSRDTASGGSTPCYGQLDLDMCVPLQLFSGDFHTLTCVHRRSCKMLAAFGGFTSQLTSLSFMLSVCFASRKPAQIHVGYMLNTSLSCTRINDQRVLNAQQVCKPVPTSFQLYGWFHPVVDSTWYFVPCTHQMQSNRKHEDVRFLHGQLGRMLVKHFGGGPMIVRWGTMQSDGSFDIEAHRPLVIAKEAPGELERPVEVYVPGNMPLAKLRAIAATAIDLPEAAVPDLAFVSPSGENLDDETRFPAKTTCSDIPVEV